ncbi:hypothetical protein ALP51_04198 [Pseudomonas savastanoi]|uniref:Uncharacterized protein n=1 Tax=Pseudomonas savastanoi TaxID=29438 RepID=A0A3M5KKY5_PSESS|nr:hypothetical protein ALP51_04198 [Pseudomonas savastanoi]
MAYQYYHVQQAVLGEVFVWQPEGDVGVDIPCPRVGQYGVARSIEEIAAEKLRIAANVTNAADQH